MITEQGLFENFPLYKKIKAEKKVLLLTNVNINITITLTIFSDLRNTINGHKYAAS